VARGIVYSLSWPVLAHSWLFCSKFHGAAVSGEECPHDGDHDRVSVLAQQGQHGVYVGIMDAREVVARDYFSAGGLRIIGLIPDALSAKAHGPAPRLMISRWRRVSC
jgi:hypothetical protein